MFLIYAGRIQTMDQNSRQIHKGGLLESMGSSMSGPPPETTQNGTQTKDIHPVPR